MKQACVDDVVRIDVVGRKPQARGPLPEYGTFARPLVNQDISRLVRASFPNDDARNVHTRAVQTFPLNLAPQIVPDRSDVPGPKAEPRTRNDGSCHLSARA